MTTFEKAKMRIERDMKNMFAPDAQAWANIMLEHTAQLTDPDEQKKFWQWMVNPYDTDTAHVNEWAPVSEQRQIEQVGTVQDGDSTVELHNQCHQVGGTTFIKTTPRIMNQTLEPLPPHLEYDTSDDEKVAR